MSVCPYERLDRGNYKSSILGLGIQIPEIPAQRKVVSAGCHAHSNAHKPSKTVAPTVLMLEKKF